MTLLNLDWKPGFGRMCIWFGADKNKKISMFINNGWGEVPLSILSVKNIKNILDDINEYCFEESEIYCKYQPDKKGSFILDIYSYWRNSNKNKSAVAHDLIIDLLDRKT